MTDDTARSIVAAIIALVIVCLVVLIVTHFPVVIGWLQ